MPTFALCQKSCWRERQGVETMTTAVLTEEDFSKFQEYFYRKTGIQFEATKRYFVDKRLL
ncbi:MAG TPA: hypothetical protein VFV28_05375, partial [Limnobacter sp.]|nr:hypothetical protein [Limnobacter sp.]